MKNIADWKYVRECLCCELEGGSHGSIANTQYLNLFQFEKNLNRKHISALFKFRLKHQIQLRTERLAFIS